MSWAHVQGTGVQASGFVSSLSCSYASPVSSGHLLVSGNTLDSTSVGPTVADNQSNSWTIDTSTTPLFTIVAAIAHAVSAGANTPTVTWSWSAGFPQASMSIDEYSVAGTISVDSVKSFANAVNSTAGATGTMTVTGNDLLYGVLATPTLTTYTSLSGATARFTGPFASYGCGFAAEDMVNVTVSGNLAWTLGTSVYWSASGVAFTVTGGGATASLFRMPTLSLGSGGSFFQTPVNG